MYLNRADPHHITAWNNDETITHANLRAASCACNHRPVTFDSEDPIDWKPEETLGPDTIEVSELAFDFRSEIIEAGAA
jgi:hypothetical protein